MSKTRKSVIFSSLSKFASIGISLVLLVVVTRWLMPAEIGAFAVAYAVITLLELIRQLQMPAYMIQASALEQGMIRAVHYVGWVMYGIVTAIGLAMAALLIAVIDQAEIGLLLLIMIPTFVINTLTQPAFGLLSREMRFGFMASVGISGALAKAVITITCLVLGLRSEALAIGILIETLPKLAYLLRADRAISFAWPSRAGAGDVWQYCVKFTGAELVNRGTTALNDILIGGFLGLAAAGMYNRAALLVRNLRSGIEGAIVPVAMTTFAKSNRESADAVKRDYLTGISLLTGITWPGLAVFTVLAEPMVLTFYGERWKGMIYLAQVLSVGAIIHATTAMAPALLASLGKVHSLLLRNLSFTVPNLTILLVTVQFDLTAVIWGWFVSILIYFVFTQSLLSRELGINFVSVMRALRRSGIVAFASAGTALGLVNLRQFAEQPPGIQLAVSLPIVAVVWLASVLLARHDLSGEIVRVARKLKPRAS